MKIMIVPDESRSIYGFANIYPKRTSGLPVVIWVDNVGSKRRVKHNIPRIKVQNVPGNDVVDDTFSLSLEENPRVLAGKVKLSSKQYKQTVEYVREHLSELLDHWNHVIDEDELKEALYRK